MLCERDDKGDDDEGIPPRVAVAVAAAATPAVAVAGRWVKDGWAVSCWTCILHFTNSIGVLFASELR